MRIRKDNTSKKLLRSKPKGSYPLLAILNALGDESE
jgi:hypothetical protein